MWMDCAWISSGTIWPVWPRNSSIDLIVVSQGIYIRQIIPTFDILTQDQRVGTASLLKSAQGILVLISDRFSLSSRSECKNVSAGIGYELYVLMGTESYFLIGMGIVLLIFFRRSDLKEYTLSERMHCMDPYVCDKQYFLTFWHNMHLNGVACCPLIIITTQRTHKLH